MGTASALLDRLRESSRALIAVAVAVLALTLAVLVSQIGPPPREAVFTTGVGVIVLLFVVYDWFYRR